MRRIIQKVKRGREDQRIMRKQFSTQDIYFSQKTIPNLLFRSYPTINNHFGNDPLAEAEAQNGLVGLQRFFTPNTRFRILGKRIIQRYYQNVRKLRRAQPGENVRCQFCQKQHITFIFVVDVMRRNRQFTQLNIGIQCASKILSVQAGGRVQLFNPIWRRVNARYARR